MNSTIGKKLFGKLQQELDFVNNPLILAGDFNNKRIPLSTILQNKDNRLLFPTEDMQTAVIDPETNHGSNIVVSKDFSIIDHSSYLNKSDAYLVSLRVTLN